MRVIFIDGDCLFCHGLVQFLNRHAFGQFYFSKLQSEFAKKNLPKKYLEDLNSVAYLEDSIIYTKSGAILKIIKYLNFPYNILGILLSITPTIFVDFLYDFIARRRKEISAKYCQSITIDKDHLIG